MIEYIDLSMSNIADRFITIISRVKPVEEYLDTSKFDPGKHLVSIVSSCLNISDPKEFKKCVAKQLDNEYKNINDIFINCYSEYKKHRDFNRFMTCVNTELEKRKSRLKDLVNYCHIALREKNLSNLYDCVFSGMEAVNMATRKAVEEYLREVKR